LDDKPTNHRPLRFTSAEIAASLLMFTGQIEGMALHFDTPIPPRSGPRRLQMLHSRGTEQLKLAKCLYSKTRDQVGCLEVHGLDSPHAPWWVYPPTIVGDGARCPNGRMNRHAESLSRDALTSAVRAFNFLEDTPEADDAHRLIHEIGMYVSRHFGCKINLQDGLWSWQCPVTIAHLRLGQSVGFTASRICSICRQNIMSDQCSHLPGQIYEVQVVDASRCPCGTDNCHNHVVGDILKVNPRSLVKEADSLDEISWVPRPRDPLARIEAISYTPERMVIMMRTEIPSNVRTIECFHCRQACTGLWDCEVLGELLNR
jgi:hypothetical protein